ncbi:MAG TPA: valine--tRNA ligase [Candidatus Peribacterales bacterium]|nr:valine--tRNA ligase [Candidatus Peribacterales bacterium]
MLEKAYDPKAVEDQIYAMWENSDAFKANRDSKKETFTISMPPPNATGQLHLGHAVMLALEDIFIRFQRMRGKEALWVPGTDHAAIATENVVIKQLKEQGIKDPRKELGREKLVAEIAKFVEQSKNTIRSQIRKMGSSCDWSRERYTFEPALNRCVNEVFKKMYEDGLIYRGHRIVNWDPKLQTTVSDDEVVYKEEASPFYTFTYGPFEIATARPETKFGDKYVVMHPNDERYKKYKHGDKFEAEWINGKVRATVIKDEAIDPAFGTGVMTITPWHDHTDFEIAERHKLDREQIIGFDGKLLPIAGEFAGLPIEEARPLIVEKLKSKGLLVKTDENYIHNKATSQRGGGAIEPQIKLQWFIDVNKKAVPWKALFLGISWKKKMSLKEVMQTVVHDGSIEIIPERFEKTYFHWIDNLRDWCISRQIWWGHRIPVWYRGEETYFGVIPPKESGWEQDPDTLDTWFSSALWTWSTLVDPKLTEDFSISLEEILKRSPDYQHFHPTQVMETGYDILFFWVARMILMTTYATGEIPFETVYLHGLIRTRDGRKMSKSDPSTMIDPLDMIAKYGADALRLSMIVGQSPGNDSKLYEEKIAGYRNFVNKLWNASRFVLMTCESAGIDPKSITELSPKEKLSLADRALLHLLDVELVADVTDALEQYRLSEVGERLYSFVWGTFCDWYLELSKGNANHAVLVHAMRRVLRLLHPYCPFITEELWASFKPQNAGMLIAEEWPTVHPERRDKEAFEAFQILIDVITAIRSIRNEHGVEVGKEITAFLVTEEATQVLEEHAADIRRLAKVKSLMVQNEKYHGVNAASAFTKHVEIHVPLEGIIDLSKEKERLTKEKDQLTKFLKGLQVKLKNADFTKNAPKEVLEKEKQKEEEAMGKLKKIEEKLTVL